MSHRGTFLFSFSKASPMSMVGFPLLLIPLAIYNIIAFLMPDVRFGEPLLKLALISGAEWQVTLSDILVALGILLLLFEVIKGARPGAKYLTDHLLSLVVFGAAAAEFVLWPKFGTSTYFLLAGLSLVDFLSGLALRTRRGVAPVAASRKDARRPDPPVFEPAAAPSVPAASSVAGSGMLDRPEPSLVQPATVPPVTSPEIPSPGLQPGSGLPPVPDTPSR